MLPHFENWNTKFGPSVAHGKKFRDVGLFEIEATRPLQGILTNKQLDNRTDDDSIQHAICQDLENIVHFNHFFFKCITEITENINKIQ